MRSYVVFGALTLALGPLAGCADALTGDDMFVTDTGDLALTQAPVQLGKKSAQTRGCVTCHDPGDGSLSGQTLPRPNTMAYGANLTPDQDTGIGGWSDDEIARAIRQGVDDQGVPLCPPMPHFGDIGDAEMKNLLAYLHSLKAVHSEVPQSMCPPLKPGTDDTDAGTLPEDLAGVVVDMAGSSFNPDGGVASPDAGMPDMAVGMGDMAHAPADLSHVADLSHADLAGSKPDLATAPADLAASGDGGTGCGVVINEVQTAGITYDDEFVEIWNSCSTGIDLTGYQLVYRSASGVNDVVLIQFTGGVIPGGEYGVLAHVNYSDPSIVNASYGATSMASHGGGVGIRDGKGKVVDSMAWGDAINAFVHTAPAPAPAASQSIERLPDGEHSGDDSKDFVVASTPTPGAANK